MQCNNPEEQRIQLHQSVCLKSPNTDWKYRMLHVHWGCVSACLALFPNFVKLTKHHKHNNHRYTIKMSFIFLFDMLYRTEALCHELFISTFNFSLGFHYLFWGCKFSVEKKKEFWKYYIVLYIMHSLFAVLLIMKILFTTEFECCPLVFPSKRRKGRANHRAGENLWTYQWVKWMLTKGTWTVVMEICWACQILQ